VAEDVDDDEDDDEFLSRLGGPLYSWNLMILDLLVVLFRMGLFFFLAILLATVCCEDDDEDEKFPLLLFGMDDDDDEDDDAENEPAVITGMFCDVKVNNEGESNDDDDDDTLLLVNLASRGVMSGGVGMGVEAVAADTSLPESVSCACWEGDAAALSLALLSASDSSPNCAAADASRSVVFVNWSLPSVTRITYSSTSGTL
jgi:hypothetical protein